MRISNIDMPFYWWIIAVFGIIALAGLIIWALWNWLMPIIFGLGTITYLQAAGLYALCALLFKDGKS